MAASNGNGRGAGGKYRVCVYVRKDLVSDFERLRRYVDSSGLSMSGYLLQAALLCSRLGIDDPECADIDGLPVASHATMRPVENKIGLDGEAEDAFNKLFF